jgi:formamidopyrimidine-DNA glycosylase
MPELPEVETIRRDLEKEAVGKRIKSVEVTGTRTVRRQPPEELVSRLEGAKVMSVTRKGKHLLLGLGEDLLVIHLGMSGQLLKAAAKDPMSPHTHVVITFTQGGQLRMLDPRTFGEMYVVSTEKQAEEAPELADLGFDPVDDVISWNTFGSMLMARKTKLKALLMDQHFMAGLGNIYTDEILWAAGLRFDRISDTLSTQEVRRLYRAMGETLQEALKLRGSSLADEQYRDLFGKVGSYQNEHKVYAREGQACRRCRQVIKRTKWGGRSTFYCGSCQV